MEQELMKELEKRREERYNEEKRREVRVRLFAIKYMNFFNLHFSLDSVSQQRSFETIFHIMLELLFLKSYIRNLWKLHPCV